MRVCCACLFSLRHDVVVVIPGALRKCIAPLTPSLLLVGLPWMWRVGSMSCPCHLQEVGISDMSLFCLKVSLVQINPLSCPVLLDPYCCITLRPYVPALIPHANFLSPPVHRISVGMVRRQTNCISVCRVHRRGVWCRTSLKQCLVVWISTRKCSGMTPHCKS
jgi:hypothetical protein